MNDCIIKTLYSILVNYLRWRKPKQNYKASLGTGEKKITDVMRKDQYNAVVLSIYCKKLVLH